MQDNSGLAMPSARATHASHRAALRRLGLSVGIAIALGGCSSAEESKQQDGWRECVDFQGHETFRFNTKTIVARGKLLFGDPEFFVTDTEGFTRKVDPASVKCRTVAQAMSAGTAETVQPAQGDSSPARSAEPMRPDDTAQDTTPVDAKKKG